MRVRFRRIAALVLLSGLLVALGSQSITGQDTVPLPDTTGEATAPWPAGSSLASPAYSGCGGDIAPAISTAYEQQVVELVNSMRAGEGLPPFKRRAELDNAARYYATDMGMDDYYAPGSDPNKVHDTYDRSGSNVVWQCDMASRISVYYTGWLWIGENIAQGYATPQDVMDGWWNSPPHKANILSTDTWEIGVGYFTGTGSDAPYWVQDFGRKSGVYPVIINGEAATTTSKTVTLYTYGSGEWDEMCVSNEGVACTNWVPFQPNMTWTLNGGKGNRTVTVQLRKGTATTSSSDTIYLDEGTTPPGQEYYVHLPITLKDHRSASSTGWQTILSEGFEGAFPGAWTVSDRGTTGGEYLWAKSTCRSKTGANSAWAIGGGVNGSSLPCGSNYPDNAESWLIYGPFSLADATAAELEFQFWLNLETNYVDYLFWGASTDKNSIPFSGWRASGDSEGWVKETLDLTAVGSLGNLAGKPQVWIALVFFSNGSTSYPEGVYVDDIVIRKYIPTAVQSPGLEPVGGTPAFDLGRPNLVVTEATIQR